MSLAVVLALPVGRPRVTCRSSELLIGEPHVCGDASLVGSPSVRPPGVGGHIGDIHGVPAPSSLPRTSSTQDQPEGAYSHGRVERGSDTDSPDEDAAFPATPRQEYTAPRVAPYHPQFLLML